MRRIRQVLQLHFGARASARVIAGTVGVGRSTVQDYLARATAAGLVWPLPSELTDEALEQLLFPAPSNRPGVRRYVEPDWSVLVREMKRPREYATLLVKSAIARLPGLAHHPAFTRWAVNNGAALA
jgi:transposase